MKYLKKIVFWIVVGIPSITLGGSESPVAYSISENIQISDIVLIVTLIAGLLTIISVAVGRQSNKTGSESEFDRIRSEYKDLENKITDLTSIDAANKIHDLQEGLSQLDDTVNNSVKKKIFTLSEHFTMLEGRVLDLDKHFDQANTERRDENRQLKSEITTLRENIREDINDVKDIIMKLMMALKTDDD